MIASWEDLCARARGRYRLIHEQPHGFAVVWRFRAAGGPDRFQMVEVTRVRQMGLAGVQLASTVGALENLPPRRALAMNAEIAAGALCLIDDVFVVRGVLPLAGLTFDVFAHSLEIIGYEAASLRFTAMAETDPVPLADMYL